MAKDIITRLKLDNSQYNRGLQQSSSALKNYEKQNLSLDGVLKQGIGTLTKFATATAAISGAMKIAADAFKVGEKGADEWGRTMKSASSLYEGFLWSLNNGDFSGFLRNIDNIVKASREAYNALDELKTKSGIISNAEAMYNSQRSKYMAIIRDQKATEQQKESARKSLEGLRGQRISSTNETKALNNKFIKKELQDAFTYAGFGDSLGKYYKQIVQSLYDTSMADKLDKIQLTSTRKKANILDPETGKMIDGGVVTITQTLGNILTDKLREKLNPYIQAYWNAEGRLYSEERRENRIIGGGSGGGSGKGKGTAKTIATQGLNIVGLGGYAYDSTTAALMANASAAAAENAKYTQFSDFFDPSKIQGLSMPEQSDKTKTKQLAKQAELAEKVGSLTSKIGEATAGFMEVQSGLSKMGIELPSGVDKLVNTISGIMQVIQGVQQIISVFQVGSTNANTLALAANTAALWANTVTPGFFAEGGVAHAANGIVAGNSYVGDKVPARINSGEMVINQQDQRKLFDAIHGENMVFGNGGFKTIIRGEDIVLVSNNYKRRTGRA